MITYKVINMLNFIISVTFCYYLLHLFLSEIVPEKSTKWVEVGPIWNDADAPGKADAWVAKHKGWEWTGNWKTTVEGEMSVIQVQGNQTLSKIIRTMVHG